VRTISFGGLVLFAIGHVVMVSASGFGKQVGAMIVGRA